MRGPAAPTSPGPWDSRSEALLRTPALGTPALGTPSLGTPALGTALPPGALDLAGPLATSAAPVSVPVPEPVPVPVSVPASAPGPAEAIQQTAPAPAPKTAPVPTPKPAPAAPPVRPRRGPADPVKALMHRHRELCERAVDPLEIAAGLEAHGVTDRTAARFRHRDVFSLAEELYARVPRGETGTGPAAPGTDPGRGGGSWPLTVCAPGALAAAATAAVTVSTDGTRTAAALIGLLGVATALVLATHRGPLRAPLGTGPATVLGTLWLLGYAAGGDGLLDQLLRGGPDGPPALHTVLDGPVPDGTWTLDTGPLLALALSVAPAAWCARLFAARARHRLAASRGLADFAAGTRPLLLGSVALHLTALAALLALTDFHPGALALGALLLTARLLAAHGLPEAATSAIGAACAAEALGLATVLAARLPGLDPLGAPVRTLVALGGPAALPTLACGLAAAALLVHATEALSRASAHV
ncbi:hypothetical protein [Streptomyces sp. NPDC090025]|uniref:hypothetical protein n=1 Tax=Streptomyces sp. NPDC090025 TaxID=3365922 RepID=UPI0038397001